MTLMDDGLQPDDQTPAVVPPDEFYQDHPIDSADYLDDERPRPGGTIHKRLPDGTIQVIEMPAVMPEKWVFKQPPPPPEPPPPAAKKG